MSPLPPLARGAARRYNEAMATRRQTGSWASALSKEREARRSGERVSTPAGDTAPSPEETSDAPQRAGRERSSQQVSTPGESALERLATALQIHPLLRWLSREQVERIAEAGALLYPEPGELLVEEGQPGDAMFLLLSGQAAVYKVGAEQRPLATLTTGDFFGEMSLLDPGGIRSATVVATCPGEAFRLPHEALIQLTESDPAAMNKLLQAMVRTLSRRLRRMNELVAEVGQLSDWLAGSLV